MIKWNTVFEKDGGYLTCMNHLVSDIYKDCFLLIVEFIIHKVFMLQFYAIPGIVLVKTVSSEIGFVNSLSNCFNDLKKIFLL